MNGPEIITLEVLAATVVVVIVAAGLLCLAVAREWVAFSVSVRTIPASKRQARAWAQVQAPAEETATALRGAA